MKKFFLFAASLLCLAACQKEQFKEDAPETIYFKATIDDDATKTTIADGGSVTWNQGDKITLWSWRLANEGDSNNTIFWHQTSGWKFISNELASESDGSSSATFGFNLTTTAQRNEIYLGAMYHALYASFTDAYSAQTARYKDSKISGTIQDSQWESFTVRTPGSGDSGITTEEDRTKQTNANVQVRVARSTSNNLSFKNIFHLIRFETSIPGAVKAILEANTEGVAVSKYNVKVYYDEAGEIDHFNSTGTNVTSLTRDIVSGWNYFALAPNMNITGGFKIKILDSENVVVATYSYSSNFATHANKISTISNFDRRTDLKEAILLSGPEVNVALKNLAAGVDNCTTNSNNQTIKEVRFVSGSDVVTSTVVSEPTSSKPVYASWDSANGIMTLSTPSVGKIFTGTDASSMFNIFVKLATIDLSNLGTDDATDMSYMFSSCHCLNNLDVSVINTSKVTNMTEMFRGVGFQSRLDHITFGGLFSMERVTNARSMFESCYANSLDLSSVSAPVLADAGGMFYDCKYLTSLALPSVTSALTTIENASWAPSYGFLQNCIALTDLDMTGFNARPSYVRRMFKDCSALATITIPDVFDTTNCSYWNEMFSGCTSLRTVNFPSLNVQGSKVPNNSVSSRMENAFENVTQCLVYCQADLSGAYYPDNVFSNGNIWSGFQSHWQLTQGTLVPDWSRYKVYFVYTNK